MLVLVREDVGVWIFYLYAPSSVSGKERVVALISRIS